MSYKHLIMKVSCRTPERMFDERFIENALLEALHKAGAHVLQVAHHNFYPHGFTMVALLSESHATVHSWPEKNLAMIDFFSCADDPKFDVFLDYLFERGFEYVSSQVIPR